MTDRADSFDFASLWRESFAQDAGCLTREFFVHSVPFLMGAYLDECCSTAQAMD